MFPEARKPTEKDMAPIPILYSGNMVTALDFQYTMFHWNSVSKANIQIVLLNSYYAHDQIM
jgi:hypothetical protein